MTLDETTECNLRCLGGEPCGEGPGVLSVWNVEDLTGPIFTPYFRLRFTGSANSQVRTRAMEKNDSPLNTECMTPCRVVPTSDSEVRRTLTVC